MKNSPRVYNAVRSRSTLQLKMIILASQVDFEFLVSQDFSPGVMLSSNRFLHASHLRHFLPNLAFPDTAQSFPEKIAKFPRDTMGIASLQLVGVMAPAEVGGFCRFRYGGHDWYAS